MKPPPQQVGKTELIVMMIKRIITQTLIKLMVGIRKLSCDRIVLYPTRPAPAPKTPDSALII